MVEKGDLRNVESDLKFLKLRGEPSCDVYRHGRSNRFRSLVSNSLGRRIPQLESKLCSRSRTPQSVLGSGCSAGHATSRGKPDWVAATVKRPVGSRHRHRSTSFRHTRGTRVEDLRHPTKPKARLHGCGCGLNWKESLGGRRGRTHKCMSESLRKTVIFTDSLLSIIKQIECTCERNLDRGEPDPSYLRPEKAV